MEINEKLLDELEISAQLKFQTFIKLDEVREEYETVLPNGVTLDNLIMRLEFIDIRIYNIDKGIKMFRVSNSLFLSELENEKLGNYVWIFEENGELIDEFLDFISDE